MDEDAFIAALDERVRAEAPDVAAQLAQAAPYHHIHKGLSRWLSKRGG
jgi:hypothetical protein